VNSLNIFWCSPFEETLDHRAGGTLFFNQNGAVRANDFAKTALLAFLQIDDDGWCVVDAHVILGKADSLFGATQNAQTATLAKAVKDHGLPVALLKNLRLKIRHN